MHDASRVPGAMPSPSNIEWMSVSACLISCYLVLTLVHAQAFHRHLRQPSHGWQSWFYLLIAIGSISRVAYFSVLALVSWDSERIWTPLFFLINTISPIAFFSAYLILLFLLIEVYHARASHAMHMNVFFLCISALCLTYALLTALNMLRTRHSAYNELQSNNVYEEAIVLMSALIYLVTAITFSLYGLRLRAQLRRLQATPMRESLEHRIGAISGVVTVFFLARSAIVLYALFTVRVNFDWWFLLGYYLLCELAPLTLMTWILRLQHSQTEQHAISAGKLLVRQRPPAYLSLAHTREAPPAAP